jgi:hypothetical protein
VYAIHYLKNSSEYPHGGMSPLSIPYALLTPVFILRREPQAHDRL